MTNAELMLRLGTLPPNTIIYSQSDDARFPKDDAKVYITYDPGKDNMYWADWVDVDDATDEQKKNCNAILIG